MKKESMTIKTQNSEIKTELIQGNDNFEIGRDSFGSQDAYSDGGLGHDKQGGDYIGNAEKGYKGLYAKFDEKVSKSINNDISENDSISSIMNKINNI